MSLPVFVTSFTNTSSGSTTLTATLPTVTDGQVVLVRFATQKTCTVAVAGGSGWTVIQDSQSGIQTSAVLVGKVVTAADSGTVLTATFGGVNPGRNAVIGRVYGNAQLPTQSDKNEVTPTSTTYTSPAITTATANSLVTIWQTEQPDAAGGRPTFTQPTGATNSVGVTSPNTAGINVAMGSADIAAPTAGTYGPHTATSSLTGVGAASVVVLPASVSALAFTGSATPTGSGTLAAAGAPALSGAAALSGAGTLTAAATPAASGAVALSGSGALTATGKPAAGDTAALTGSGSLTATGTAVDANSFSGTVALTGSGALTTSGTPKAAGTATLTGSGALITTGQATYVGTATLTGSGSLAATGAADALTAPAIDVAVTIGPTRLRNAADVGQTRQGVVVQLTRTGVGVGATRQGVTVGATRQQRS